MNTMRVNVLIIIMIAVGYSSLQAQNNNLSTKKVILNGREFYLHTVQQGEGLYRISVNYGVSRQEILQVNDDISEDLKIGQIIRIPVISGQKSDSQETNKSGSYTYHTVEKGQTAFFVSRKYNVPLEVIYDNNPGSREVLSEGAILKIPSGQPFFEKPVSTQTNNDDVVYHTVQPKETLFALSREYNTTVEKIIEANPVLQNSALTIGSTIKIPKNQVVTASINTNSPVATQQSTENDKLFIYHKVRKKETLYGISRTYGVDENSIKSHNPSVNFNNLKVGEQLKIPTEAWFAQQKAPQIQIPDNNISIAEETISNDNTDAQIVIPTCTNTTLGYEIPIKVALMLPFSAREAQRYFSDTISSSTTSRNAALRSKPFIEFYTGMLLAIEVLKKQGVNINLQVFDISAESNAIQNALNNSELQNVDLIIGPGVTNELPQISAFSNRHSIPLVYPMSNANPELFNNPNMFHINSPDSLFHDLIADEIIRQAKGENMLVILPAASEREATKLAEIIKQKVTSYNQLDVNKINYKEYRSGRDDVTAIEALIDKDKHTFIVMPTQLQTEVSKLVPTLAVVKGRTKANITLFGMSSWLRFQTLDPENIYQLNGTFFPTFAVDYRDPNTRQFIDNYRQAFNTEPFPVHPYFQSADANSSFSRYGIWGYDVSLYFINAVYKYGKNFGTCLENYYPQQIQFNFDFKRISNQGGYYNNGLYMIRFKSDFATERVRISVRK